MKLEFTWARGFGKHNHVVEIVDFEEELTETEQHEAFEEWVWQQIGDQFGFEVVEEDSEEEEAE